jgi:hypothetical protein
MLIGKIDRIGVYYSFNLLGSASGGILFFLLLARFEFAWQIKILSVLLISSLMFFKKKKWVVVIEAALIIFIPYKNIKPSEFKDISKARNVPEYNKVMDTRTPYGRITVLSSDFYRDVPGLCLNFPGDIGGHYLLFEHGNNAGSFPMASSLKEMEYFEYVPSALAYIIRQPGKVLSVSSHGDWLKSYYLGTERVSAVSGNSFRINAVKEIIERAGYDINLRSLKLIPGTGRNLIDKPGQEFDLIDINLLQTGAYFGGMRTNYILTIEGILACIRSLATNGVLCITADRKNPPRIMPRMLNLFERAGRKLGIATEDHLIVLRGWNTNAFIFLRKGLTHQDSVTTRAFLKKFSFDLGSGSGSGAHLDFSVPPDSRPFFYYFNPFFKSVSLFFKNRNIALNLVTFDEMLLFLTLVVSVFLGLVFILFPAAGFISGKGKQIPFSGTIYFICIGFGFFFIEMLMIQKLNRYTGDYLVSFIIVLTLMLVSAGIGSWHLAPIAGRNKNFARLCLLFPVFFYLPLYLVSDSAALLIPAAVFLILTGLCMGIYFPLGMKMVASRGELAPAWMWAFNGLGSVIAPALQTVISVRAGFHTVFAVSALLYMAAGFVREFATGSEPAGSSAL